MNRPPSIAPVGGQSAERTGLGLRQLLAERAAQHAKAPAIAAPGRRPLTYAQLFAQVERTAAELEGLGLRRGDRIGLVLPNGPEAAVAFLAVASCATCAPLNPAYRADEFQFYLADLKAQALIVQAGVDSPARAVAQSHGIALIELTPALDHEAGRFTLSMVGRVSPSAPQLAPVSTDGALGETRPTSSDVALVLHTSGTTSRPKIVPLTHANLCASSLHIAATLQLRPEDRCLNVMPLFHIHGLVGALCSSLAAGASVLCAPGFFAPRFFEWLEEFRPSWYTAVPTMHQAILARAPAHRDAIVRCPLRFIRSSSAALPPQAMAELEAAFGVPVIEAYGMTEAAHQMASNPLPPRARKPGSVGLAAGPEVAIMDQTGTLLPAKRPGEIVIRGPNVTPGYADNAAANEAAFAHGWFHTGDQGYLDEDGYLFVTGRLKEIINRSGEKISPREIDEVLLAHPAVAQAVAFAVPDPQLGEDVAAAVVLREDRPTAERDLREFAAARLADFKVPRRVVIVSEIPKGATGKLQRIGLAEKLGLVPVPDPGPRGKTEFVAPRTALEQVVAGIWQEVLGIEKAGAHDRFLDLGGDSILATQILSRLSDLTGAELSALDLFEAPTVAGLAEVITSRQSKAAHADGLLDELQHLSDEEAERLLAEESERSEEVASPS
jgi:acyl-CoA synthetase (AMP-forming)/AMP-acid ligase II/acyl carrier protein